MNVNEAREEQEKILQQIKARLFDLARQEDTLMRALQECYGRLDTLNKIDKKEETT